MRHFASGEPVSPSTTAIGTGKIVLTCSVSTDKEQKMTIFTSDAIDNKHRPRLASTRFHRFAAGLGLACVILMQTGCVSLI